jgi:RimJ/RimL family protein N-acetyltransferase
MTQALERHNTNIAPSDPESEIPTEREDVFLRERTPDDLRELADKNFDDLRMDFDLNGMTGLKPPRGWAYEILKRQEEEDKEPLLVGGIYVDKRGMDTGTVQLAYFIDREYRGQGLASASVAAATELLTRKYDIVANINRLNTPSINLVRGLGYASISWGDTSEQSYLKERQRAKPIQQSRDHAA